MMAKSKQSLKFSFQDGSRQSDPAQLLNLDLCSQLHHLWRRNTEIGSRTLRIALKHGVENFSPQGHACNLLGGDHRFATDIEGDLRAVDISKLSVCQSKMQSLEYVGFLLEAEPHDNALEAGLKRGDCHPIFV